MRPTSNDYAPFYHKYIEKIESNDIKAVLKMQLNDSIALFQSLTDAITYYRYAEGKWSIKQILGHIIDCERIFAFRALHFGRADQRELAGFDEDEYARQNRAEERDWDELVMEYQLVRHSSIALLTSFNEEEMAREGKANGYRVTVNALFFIMAGHEKHHINVIQERYLVDK